MTESLDTKPKSVSYGRSNDVEKVEKSKQDQLALITFLTNWVTTEARGEGNQSLF